MTAKDLANLLVLIENELHLASMLMHAAKITHSEEHRAESVLNAKAAYESAERFIGKLPPGQINPLWEGHLAELRQEIQAYTS